MLFMQAEGNRGPIDDFWYKPLSWSEGHQIVSPENALRLSVVYACMRILAETVAYVPLPMYRRRSDGGKERVTNHPIARLINLRPNKWQTPMEFREMMQGHLAIRGNAYAWKKFAPNGTITELIPLHPDRVKPQRIAGTMALRYLYKDPDNQEHTLRQSEVLHLRGISSDGLVGMNPIEVERIAISFGLTTQDYGRRFYENDASSGNWIEFPGKFENLEARRKFREAYQSAQTGGNRFKTPVLDQGMKLHEMRLKNTDAQFLETRKYQDTDICRIFRIQPHKVGILDRATFSNIEQQALEFVTDTMMPWFTRWEERLSLDLLNEDEQQEYFFEFLAAGLMRGDSAARSTYFNKAILTGWMTRNEARTIENMNPLPGLDEPLEPLNMQEVGDETEDATAPDGDEQKPKQPKQPNQRRFDVMERQTATFLVKREIQNARGLYGRQDPAAARGGIDKFYAEYGAFIAKTLVIDPVKAAEYAEDSRNALLAAYERDHSGESGAFVALLEAWAESRATELLEKVKNDD